MHDARAVDVSAPGRGDDFADAPLGVAGKERPNVLSHPGPADFACDAIRILGGCELEDQDQVRLIDLRDAGSECPCIDHELHPLSRRLDGRVRHRLAEMEVVGDDVHQVDATGSSGSPSSQNLYRGATGEVPTVVRMSMDKQEQLEQHMLLLVDAALRDGRPEDEIRKIVAEALRSDAVTQRAA